MTFLISLNDSLRLDVNSFSPLATKKRNIARDNFQKATIFFPLEFLLIYWWINMKLIYVTVFFTPNVTCSFFPFLHFLEKYNQFFDDSYFLLLIKMIRYNQKRTKNNQFCHKLEVLSDGKFMHFAQTLHVNS